jgi:hypothetical protein
MKEVFTPFRKQAAVAGLLLAGVFRQIETEGVMLYILKDVC